MLLEERFRRLRRKEAWGERIDAKVACTPFPGDRRVMLTTIPVTRVSGVTDVPGTNPGSVRICAPT